jgi:hypothetical protein
MKNQLTLTGGRKIMNMGKLGTVSAAGNNFHSTTKPNSGGALKATTYTLCANQKTINIVFKALFAKWLQLFQAQDLAHNFKFS